MNDSSPRSPRLAAALSALLPGLGQLYAGERAQGWAVLTMAVGVLAGVGLALWGPPPLRSRATVALLLFIYPFVWWPAVTGARGSAAGAGGSWLARGEAWYTVLMLVTVGPMALPLLWQNPRFSHRAKRLWTAVVIAAFLLGLVFAFLLGPWLEQRLGQMLELLTGLHKASR